MIDMGKYTPQWVNMADINTANTALMYRKNLNTADLAESLKVNGQKSPVTLWKRKSGETHIISGFRRVAAAKELGWTKVLGVIIPESDLSKEEAITLNFQENIAKKTLSTLDIIYACKKLSEQGRSNVKIGRLIGKSEGQVRRYLKVAKEPEDVQAKVHSGEVSIRSIENASSSKELDARDENKHKNAKCYVKSTNNGFSAAIKFDRNQHDPVIVKSHLADIKKALRKSLKGHQKATLADPKQVNSASNIETLKDIAGQAAAASKEIVENTAKNPSPADQPAYSNPSIIPDQPHARPTIADIEALKALMGKARSAQATMRKKVGQSQPEGLQKQMELFKDLIIGKKPKEEERRGEKK